MQIPKVLLVNDDPASLYALESLLIGSTEDCGYQLVSAGSGQEALRQVLLHEFAVILLDVDMPGMDGFETAEAIHSHPRSAKVPIIFLTAHYADEMHRLKAYQSGAADYLFTPVIPKILQTKVDIFVELTKKNLALQEKTEQLARLNQDLRIQRVQDLERSNRELELEVAERKLAEQRAYEMSIRDPLTGLVNRRSLIQQLEHAVATADRQGTEFALLFIDLDKFKSVNDLYGHEVGDELLRQVAARLVAAVRVSDMVARLGGDEFVVLLEGQGAGNAARVARKIEQANARAFEINGQRLRTGTSVGIALYPQDAPDARVLMKHADAAMYHAKQYLGGCTKFFHDELNLRESEREQWAAELQQALDGGQLELLYLPRHDVGSGRMEGVDTLLHWHHPRLGLIAAPEFLPAVCDRVLLDTINDWTIAAACAQVRQWEKAAPALPRLAVGVRLCASLIQPELASRILAYQKKCSMVPPWLELQIPEPLLQGAQHVVAPVLQRLHAGGVRVAVDDFGSAAIALGVLKGMPLDCLRIDPSIVRSLGRDSGGTDLAAAMVHIGRALGLDVLAKGVSTDQQLGVLSALGCDAWSGELHGPPLQARAILALLREPANQALAIHHE